MPKATKPFSRANSVEDTTIGWRLINPKMQDMYGVDSMPQTAENVAKDFNISREDQDNFALLSQKKAALAINSNKLKEEMGTYNKESKEDVDLSEYRICNKVRWIVTTISKYTPWESLCLVQALTVQKMLKKRNR